MITIYSTTTCPSCHMVEEYYHRKNVQTQTVVLDDLPELRQSLINKTGYTTVPITTDGETYVVGYNPSKLMELIA